MSKARKVAIMSVSTDEGMQIVPVSSGSESAKYVRNT